MCHFAHMSFSHVRIYPMRVNVSVCVRVCVCVCEPNVRCDTENSVSHLDLKRVSEYYELSMARRETELAAYQEFT